jgi:hypothetical protein
MRSSSHCGPRSADSRDAVLAGGGYALPRLVVALVLVQLVGLPQTGSTSAPRASSGDIDALTRFILTRPSTPILTGSRFLLVQGRLKLSLHIKTFYSADAAIDYRDNRCTADPTSKTITCDLRFLSNLATELDLVQAARKPRVSSSTMRHLLKWVLAHEVGHVVLHHEPSDYADPMSGYLLYAPPQQRAELEADAYALELVGNLSKAPSADYSLLLDIVNLLIRRNLCPDTYPVPCSKLAPGVGLIFNSADGEPIRIAAGGNHPEFVARFLRLIYLAGKGTKEKSINYLAGEEISKLIVEVPGRGWQRIDEAFVVTSDKPEIRD